MTVNTEQLEGIGTYEYGWSDSDAAGATAKRGLSEAVVRDISAKKSEPQWMLDMRLKGLKLFERKPMPTFGADLSGIDFDNIKYFVRSTEKQATSWEELPDDIKNTYDRLGIPEAETEAFGRLLGTHVMRLATLSHGDGVCTTHIPTTIGPNAASPTGADDAAKHSEGRTTR